MNYRSLDWLLYPTRTVAGREVGAINNLLFFSDVFMTPARDKIKGQGMMPATPDKSGFLKRHSFFIPFLIIFLLPLFSCVPETELIHLNDQIITLNKKVSKLEAGQASIDKQVTQDIGSELEPIRTSQAANSADLEQVRGALDAQSGRIEDIEHIIKRVIERDLTEQDQMMAELTLMTQRVAELEMMVKQQQDYLKLEKPSGMARAAPAGTPAVQRDKAPETVVIPLKPKTSELALYDSSLATYRERRYQEAMAGFQDFVRRYPQSDLADNAYFWIGESHMALNRYAQAILAYQEVIKKYPKGNKVPSALLRQAIAFVEIKDEMSAKLLLKKIIKKYPKSSEAKIAQTRLKSLGR